MRKSRLNLQFVVLLFFAGSLTPISALAQSVTQDWALHDAGQVIQIITNRGILNKLGTDYSGLINSEYPPNSFQEHMGGVGIWIGGIPTSGPNAGDTLVSVTKGHGSADEFLGFSSQPWDTVWVAQRGDTTDVKYAVPYPDGSWYLPARDSAESGYVPVSDQDIITRYNDYNALSRNLQNHLPLYVDVVQTSYAYGSPPLDEIIFVNYAVIPTQSAIDSLYLTSFVDGNVGYRTGQGFAFSNDDYSTYSEEYRMGISHDAPGGEDGGEYTPMGMMIFPPDRKPQSELTWTWRYGDIAPSQDQARYEQMKSGQRDPDQTFPTGTRYFQAFGPYNVAQGDTLKFTTAVVMGMDADSVLINAELARFAVEREFRFPAPPPSPTVEVSATSGQVTLDWSAAAERVEGYEDPNRADDVEQPFEGYRVWKSTQTAQGPWTLLGVYDVSDNGYPPNGGLRHTYTDVGLVNNVEYYYAVTAFSKPDSVINWPSQASSISANALTIIPGSGPQDSVEKVAVVPNPYRGDIRYQDYNPPWEKPPPTRERWVPQDRRLQFINLPPRCEIKVYTMSGRLVQTLHHESQTRGFESWNLTSRTGQAIASGIYLYTVEDLDTGRAQTGTFVVIK